MEKYRQLILEFINAVAGKATVYDYRLFGRGRFRSTGNTIRIYVKVMLFFFWCVAVIIATSNNLINHNSPMLIFYLEKMTDQNS